MANVSSINPHLQSLKCPAPLRALPAWVVWRYETLPGETKPRKTPFYVDGSKRWGRQGTPEDRARLVTFELARLHAAKRGFDGVGFCPMPEFGIVALDFDDCVEGGRILPEIEQMLVGTYSEFSPSGRGVRAFFRGNLSNRKSHARKGWPFGFETFSSKGFITVTGNLTPDADLCSCDDTIADITPGVQALYDLRFRQERERQEREPFTSSQPPLGVTERQMRQALDVLDPGCDYDEWLDVGMGLHHETSGSDLGLALWNAWSADWAEYPGEELLAAKWDSFGRHEGGRQVTFRSVIRRANELGAGINLSSLSIADFDEIADAQNDEDGAVAASDDFEVLPEEAGAEKPKARFQLLSAAEFLQRKSPTWLVKDVLPQAELAVICGAPGDGKTFMALDLNMAVVRGVPWRGKRVKQGKAVYIVAEGAAGFRNRLAAYLAHHQIGAEEIADFHVIAGAPNFMDKDQAGEVIEIIKTLGKGVRLVTVDTLAQVSPGADENNGKDMGVVLKHCKGIRKKTGGMVLLVAHVGKDASRGIRGWSGTNGAADAVLEVRKADGGREMRVLKQKDGDDSLSWAFDLDVVPVGMDEDLAPITSCVVRELDTLPRQQVKAADKKLGTSEKGVVEALQQITEASGEPGADFDEVVERAVENALEKGSTAKAKGLRYSFKRALECLCSDETTPYRLEDGRVYVD